jgi:hypothetical protein
MRIVTKEFANRKPQADRLACTGQISDPALIAAMHGIRLSTAERTSTGHLDRVNLNQQAGFLSFNGGDM